MNQQYNLKIRCRRTLILTAVLGLCGAGWAVAQAPQQKPTQPSQQPSKPPAENNPFPQDTSNVPVIPTSETPAAPPTNAALPPPPSGPDDPVRSPDDPVGNPEAESVSGFSSSSSGLDKMQPPPDPDTPRGRHRLASPQEPQPHQETAKEDEDVGRLYLDQKNWRAAVSRFQSAVVLDPENPEVYWGLAEAERHLGQFGAAKSNYEKVMEYDPDSKHAKEAKKLLTGPELANASTAPATQP
jgi:tetratricopeptide (TPR) repeat protein